MTAHKNPFDRAADADRFALWEMLVERDIAAFAAGDWSAVADDFDAGRFSAVDGAGSLDPDLWALGFPDLEDYRRSWLEQSDRFRADYEDPAGVLREATTLRRIEVAGGRALAHKRFDRVAATRSGRRVALRWRTVYQCTRQSGRWRITGFVGYLPLESAGATRSGDVEVEVVQAPPSSQHTTAGAYSPVLAVVAPRVVVISGQAALDGTGAVTSPDLDVQVADTLDSCARQLAAAGAGLADVFKVTVYLADIGDWAAFDAVYRARMPGSPLPVRTAVGVRLLPGLRIEIEMWAATR